MASLHNVRLSLDNITEARKQLKRSENELKKQFEELIRPLMPIGSVIDTSKVGLAYDARVMGGRGYGSQFRLESEVTVYVETGFPSYSRWVTDAISVDPEDHTRTRGKQVQLKGFVFPVCIVGRNITPDAERAMEGVAAILKELEAVKA